MSDETKLTIESLARRDVKANKQAVEQFKANLAIEAQQIAQAQQVHEQKKQQLAAMEANIAEWEAALGDE